VEKVFATNYESIILAKSDVVKLYYFILYILLG